MCKYAVFSGKITEKQGKGGPFVLKVFGPSKQMGKKEGSTNILEHRYLCMCARECSWLDYYTLAAFCLWQDCLLMVKEQTKQPVPLWPLLLRGREADR